MTERLCFLCLLAVLFCAGCPPISTNTYEVRRSALVPALAAPMRAGRPIDGRVQMAAHASTNLLAADPDANGHSSMYVARTTLGTAARFRVGRSFDIGPVFSAGVGGDAMPAGPDLPEQPGGNTIGTGISMQLAPRFEDERFGLAGVLDVMLFSIPIREEWWCLDCGASPVLDYVENDSELTPIYSLSLLPSFQPDPDLTLFGGVTIRNQPVVRRSETVTTAFVGEGDSDEELEAGPVNVVASLGGEAHIGSGARVLLLVSQPISQSPVQYGPSLSASLSWSFGAPAE